MNLAINKCCGHHSSSFQGHGASCGMKMVLPRILKQLHGQNSCLVFLLFYLSHTIKMSVYLLHIRRVVFNCLVIGWIMGQAVILLKLLLIKRYWNEILIGEHKIWRLFLVHFFWIDWRKIQEAVWYLQMVASQCWKSFLSSLCKLEYAGVILDLKLNEIVKAFPGRVFL